MNPTFIKINNKRAIKLTNNNDLSFCAIASLNLSFISRILLCCGKRE